MWSAKPTSSWMCCATPGCGRTSSPRSSASAGDQQQFVRRHRRIGQIAALSGGSIAERDPDGVAAADDDGEALAWGGLVGAAEDGGEGGGAAGLGDDAESLPQGSLPLANRLVGHEHHLR